MLKEKENAKQLLTQRHEETVQAFKVGLARQEEKNLRPCKPALWKVELTVLTCHHLHPCLEWREKCLCAAWLPSGRETLHA